MRRISRPARVCRDAGALSLAGAVPTATPAGPPPSAAPAPPPPAAAAAAPAIAPPGGGTPRADAAPAESPGGTPLGFLLPDGEVLFGANRLPNLPAPEDGGVGDPIRVPEVPAPLHPAEVPAPPAWPWLVLALGLVLLLRRRRPAAA